MLPSRGLRWSRQTIATSRRRLEAISSRHCSSVARNAPIRPNPLFSRNGASSSRIYTKDSFSNTSLLIRNGTGVRFASTAPIPAAATSASTTADPPPVASSPAPPAEVVPSSLDNATDFSTQSIYDIPEQIGYLKSLGLDYGWGPTAAMEWLIEHIHIYAGTPWWISISLAALAVRAVLFKPYIAAADNAARMQAVKPLTDPITKQMMAIRGDTPKVLQLRSEIQTINRRAGVKLWKSFVPMTQIFAGYGTFVLLRAMAKLPVPGLENGGALWFHNLTIPDPYFVIPFSTALALHWVLRKGGETSASNMSPQALKIMTVVLPTITFAVTCFMPAALQISFFVSGILSLGQATLFRVPAFRSYFNMYPLTTPTTEKPNPYKGTMKVRAPLTQDELNRTYQGSRPAATLSPEFKAGKQALQNAKPPGSQNAVRKFVTGAVQGAVKDITTTVKDATQSAREMVGKGKSGMANKQAQLDRSAADAYEAKRQKEIRQARYEREEARRAMRAARLDKTNKRL